MKHYLFVDYATQGYAALVTLVILLFHNHTIPAWPILVSIHLAGLLLVDGMIRLHARGWGGKALDFLRHFYPVLFFAWFYSETGRINRLFFAQFLDPAFIRFEQALFGFQPSVRFMDALPYRMVGELFYFAYFSYYLMIGGVGIALFFRNRRQFFHYVSVVSFLFYVCYVIYILFPIIGPPLFYEHVPGYSLPAELQALAGSATFPDAIQAGLGFKLMAWIYRTFETPGAAFPSSHVAVAVCTTYFSFRYLRPIRYLHLTLALLLCLATVYCRYHFVVDVFAGLLTAALVMPLGNWFYRRFGSAAEPAPDGSPAHK